MVKNKIIRAATVDWSVDFFRDFMLNMREKGYDMIALSAPGKCLSKLSIEDNFRVIEVPMERQISLWKDIKSLLRLISIFKKEKPMVVHSITPKAGLLCMTAALISRVPIRIHTFTGLIWPTATGIKRVVLMAADKIICMSANYIIPEGKGVMNDLLTSITKKEMRVLGYGNILGVDMQMWDPKRFKEIKKNNEYFQFIFTGRIVGDKGINELIWAFVQLQNKFPNIRLKLIGVLEKDLDPILPETYKEIMQNPSIEISGPFYGDDLIKLYVQSDCFVMPSYREGFPNSVLEAGAIGLPQIVTDINGSREIIENKVNGLVIPSKDKIALYNAMKIMYQDNLLREKMANNARKMISSRFERRFVQQCQLDFYQEILDQYV